MAEPSSPPDDKPPEFSDSTLSVRSGGIDIAAQQVSVGGDVVGRDKIVTGYTADQVQALLVQISASFQPRPFDGRCPYLGLDAFGEEDADRFFGREKLVADLIARVRDSRFVMIAGPSGSGKSSLVRAGLLHQLRHGALPGSERWLYTVLKPGRDPLEQLALAMARMAKSPDAGHYIRRSGASHADILHESAESLLSDRRDQRAVIVVDQFEETFTQVSNENERAAFLHLLTRAATVENGRVTVLPAMRSDFVAGCASYPALNALLNGQFMQIGAIQPDELVSAIAQPALRVGLRIDPDLIAQIVEDMRDEPGALPLMQFALKDLFDAQQARGGVIALTLVDYLAPGGLHKSLERHADASFAQLNEMEKRLARDVFGGLIQVGRGTQDTRRTARLDELVPAGVEAASVEVVVQKLADARLITTDISQTSEVFADPRSMAERAETSEVLSARTVTIAHETLIDAWPWLRRLVNENRDAIALQNQIAEDAAEWERSNRDASYLYSGARLATAREQLEAKKLALSAVAQTFVETAIETQEKIRRKQRRQTLGLIGGLAAVAVVLAGLAGLAFTAQQAADMRSRESRSRELAAVALSQIEVDPERAILIALEANRAAITYESQNALRQALLASRLQVTLREDESWVNSAAFSPDGARIVTASYRMARVWDAATGKELAVLHGHESWVNSAAYSPDGARIVTASDDRTARVWDAATGAELAVLRGHEDRVTSAAFAPDGARIVTASWDDTARVWDAATGAELAILRGHESWVNSAAFSPDGARIVTASYDRTARVWDAATGAELAVLRGHSAAYSPDGARILTASDDHTARVWDVATGAELVALRGHEGGVNNAAFSPNGARIVTASGGGTARVWDAEGAELAVLRGHEYGVHSAAFSPDGTRIVTAGVRTARVWDAAAGAELAVLRGHESWLYSAAFSPDGTRILTASRDDTARVWDAATGARLAVLRGHEGTVTSAAFSPDGTRIVTASGDRTARVWDAAAGAELAVLRGHERWVSSAAFSPDGTRIVTASDRTARVWDAAAGAELAVLRGHEGTVTSAVFSPDGARIVTASDDGTARVWDAATGKELAVLRGHEDVVWSAVFSPDGTRIVTASSDDTARAWDVATGAELAVLRGHEDWVYSAAYSPDGARIVTASQDGTARVYLVHIEDLIALAKTRVTRELTCQERVLYLHEDIVCPTATPTPTP